MCVLFLELENRLEERMTALTIYLSIYLSIYLYLIGSRGLLAQLITTNKRQGKVRPL